MLCTCGRVCDFTLCDGCREPRRTTTKCWRAVGGRAADDECNPVEECHGRGHLFGQASS
jgi:hypothetical protein